MKIIEDYQGWKILEEEHPISGTYWGTNERELSGLKFFLISRMGVDHLKTCIDVVGEIVREANPLNRQVIQEALDVAGLTWPE